MRELVEEALSEKRGIAVRAGPPMTGGHADIDRVVVDRKIGEAVKRERAGHRIGIPRAVQGQCGACRSIMLKQPCGDFTARGGRGNLRQPAHDAAVQPDTRGQPGGGGRAITVLRQILAPRPHQLDGPLHLRGDSGGLCGDLMLQIGAERSARRHHVDHHRVLADADSGGGSRARAGGRKRWQP